MHTQLRKPVAVVVLAVATFAAYFNALTHPFVWDDHLLVATNPQIRNSTYLAAAFTTDLFHADRTSAGYYRPLQTVSYMVDYFFWGLNPKGYHLTNVLLHFGCVVLVWRLALELSGHNGLATIIAALFAVHPVNTNAVTYVSGRADSLALAGMLGALLCFIRYRRDRGLPGLYLLCALAYVAALFSRESAVLFPFLVFVYCFSLEERCRGRFWDSVLSALPFAVLAAAFLLWRSLVLQACEKPVWPAAALPVEVRGRVVFAALATYAGLLVWPVRLQMQREVLFGDGSPGWLVVAGIGVVVGWVVLVRWAVRRRDAVMVFGLWWAAVMLVPVCGLLGLPATVAEHWLYGPSVGVYLGAAMWLRRSGRLGLVLCGLGLVALTLRTVDRNRDWGDEFRLYVKTRQAAPYSAGVRNNLAGQHAAAGRLELALRELREAERLMPFDPLIRLNLAAVHLAGGDLEAARLKAWQAVRLDDCNSDALLLLAQVAERAGDAVAARRYYLRALSCGPAVGPRLAFARWLLRQGRVREAVNVLAETQELEPGNAEVFWLLGAVLMHSGQRECAARALAMAESLDRHWVAARVGVSRPL